MNYYLQLAVADLGDSEDREVARPVVSETDEEYEEWLAEVFLNAPAPDQE